MPDLSAYRLTGANNSAKQASLNWGNAVVGALTVVPINPEDHGIVEGDANGANAATNDAAWAALYAALTIYNESGNWAGLHPIKFGPGHFEFSDPIDISNGAIELSGSGCGHGPATVMGGTTVLKFTDCTGIRVQDQDTEGHDTNSSPTHNGGNNSHIRDLCLEGSFAGTEAEYHGLHFRGTAFASNVVIRNFAGDGVSFDAESSGNGGNATNCTLFNVTAWNCRDGIHTVGNTSGGGTITGGGVRVNRRWGIHSEGTVGNTYFGVSIGQNGVNTENDGSGIGAAAVLYSGNLYGAIAGQESGASTNAPSGTTANNTWWYYIGAGPVPAGTTMPAWVSGMDVRAGGAVRESDGASRNVFVGCYAEYSKMPKAQINPNSLVVGGFLSLAIHQNTGAGLGTAVLGGGQDGAVTSQTAFEVTNDLMTNRLGDTRGNSVNAVIRSTHTTYAPSSWYLTYSTSAPVGDLRLAYAASSTQTLFWGSGPSTTAQFGTGAAKSYALYVPTLMIGDSVTNGRQMTNGTAAPASGAHGVGEIVWNRVMAVGQPIGWACTVAGTPGTWVAMANL